MGPFFGGLVNSILIEAPKKRVYGTSLTHVRHWPMMKYDLVESPIFTRQVNELLGDEEYSEPQQFLASQPDAGDVVQGTGGLRKVRWAVGGKGKRGGVRVIYFHAARHEQIRMLLIYRKGVKDDLSGAEKKVLRGLNEGW